jgi:hypothetical protein
MGYDVGLRRCLGANEVYSSASDAGDPTSVATELPAIYMLRAPE